MVVTNSRGVVTSRPILVEPEPGSQMESGPKIRIRRSDSGLVISVDGLVPNVAWTILLSNDLEEWRSIGGFVSGEIDEFPVHPSFLTEERPAFFRAVQGGP